jgi:RNA-directed DNA polymerase
VVGQLIESDRQKNTAIKIVNRWLEVVTELNASLRGWTGYFHYRNSTNVFRNAKMQIEERLRTHQRRRHKIKSRGAAYDRFPNHSLYERYGLLKLPTTAGWKKAHA